MALERGEVVEELRLLALLLLLEARDLAGLALDVGDDRRCLVLLDPLAAEVAAVVGAVAARLERGLDEPVRLGDECADLLLAARDERERRRLHAAERDRAAERRPQADRRGARGVHPDEPVGLGAGARGRLEQLHLGARAQVLERLLDRLLRHRVQPEALDGLVDPGGLVDVREDQLALAPGVARVDDPVDPVVLQELVDRPELLLRLLVVRDQAEALGDDRQVGEAPLLELRVVVLGRRQADEVPDRPRDDVVVRLEVRVVLLKCARKRAREVAPDGRLLGDDECLAHRITLAKGATGDTGPDGRLPTRQPLLLGNREPAAGPSCAGRSACGCAGSRTSRRAAASSSPRTTSRTSIPGRSASRSILARCTSWGRRSSTRTAPALVPGQARDVPRAPRRARRGRRSRRRSGSRARAASWRCSPRGRGGRRACARSTRRSRTRARPGSRSPPACRSCRRRWRGPSVSGVSRCASRTGPDRAARTADVPKREAGRIATERLMDEIARLETELART